MNKSTRYVRQHNGPALTKPRGKGGKKKSSQNAHTTTQPQPSKAMVAPNQPQHFKPEIQVQVGHMYSAQPVAVMTISGKTATIIISALGVG